MEQLFEMKDTILSALKNVNQNFLLKAEVIFYNDETKTKEYKRESIVTDLFHKFYFREQGY